MMSVSFPDDKPGSLARPVHLGDAVDSVDTLLSSVDCRVLSQISPRKHLLSHPTAEIETFVDSFQ